MENRSRVRLIPEEPVGLKGDALGFTAYARTLADAARESSQPLTIGIFGPWGTGKSSLMQMVSDVLEADDKIVSIKCNAWQYQHEDQPLFPLVASVIRGYDDYCSDQSRVLDAMLGHLKRAADEANSEAASQWSITQVSAAPIDMPDRLDTLLGNSQYAKAFELLSEIKVPQGWRFVVFVDDLDRCSPERAVRLLESIKLVLNQPGFVFVLGVSRDVIKEHLEHLYREVMGVKNFDGSSYLEKLVQLPFPIPSHRERINKLAGRLAEDFQEPELDQHLKMLAPVFEHNPRALIRVVNNLMIDRSINEILSADKSVPADERMQRVPIGMFAVSRALQHRWPSVHRLLEMSSEAFAKKVAGWQQTTVPDTDLPGKALPEDERYVADAMRDSPELTSLLHSAAGIAWLNDEDGRGAAARFVRQHKRETTQTSVEKTMVLDAYISYPRDETDVAQMFWKNLGDEGMTVFLDQESVLGGGRVQETMEAAMQTARALIFLFGESTASSTIQRQEAFAMLDRQTEEEPPLIIPVFLPGSKRQDVVKQFPELTKFKSIQLADQEPPYVRATEQILRSLKRGEAQGKRKS